MVFDLTGLNIKVNMSLKKNIRDTYVKYTLRGIIYFGQSHFTCRIITKDRQIWYHDGISTGNRLNYEGTWNNIKDQIDLNTCHNKIAILVFYIKSE